MSAVTLAILKALLLPPGLCLVPALLALMLRRHRRVAASLLWTSVALLYFLSTPLAARSLAGILENRHPPLPAASDARGSADAIVVLGCDRYPNAPESGRDEVSACTLARLRYAADLHARSGLPVLVSGGRPFGEPEAEAVLMDRALRERFGVVPRWVEPESRNTAESAAYSAALLRAANAPRVLLVTHAVHMPRAMRSFARHELAPVPAPTQFHSVADRRPPVFQILPSAAALAVSNTALYELFGNLWYSARGT
jgi:uncharacterized SAM-binding protein YcdF (DUF218 family)